VAFAIVDAARWHSRHGQDALSFIIAAPGLVGHGMSASAARFRVGDLKI